MEISWKTVLWPQFGAAIDMLDNALSACPEAQWQELLWPIPADQPLAPEFAAFWYVGYHALFWLDFYLSGSEEGFAPPAPITLAEFDPAGALPERPYTKEELRAYLAYTRQKGQTTLGALTDELARQSFAFPWTRGQPVSYLELQLYNLRHVQEHAAQLSLFLGQHAIPAGPSWVPRAKGEG
ncbi:MAG TPA: DinB family protein [Ktedonobacterales bacterium]